MASCAATEGNHTAAGEGVLQQTLVPCCPGEPDSSVWSACMGHQHPRPYVCEKDWTAELLTYVQHEPRKACLLEDLVPSCKEQDSSLRSAVQIFALPAVMLYLQLSLSALAMGLCAGILLAGLAAWGTSNGNNEPPVSAPILLLSNIQRDWAKGFAGVSLMSVKAPWLSPSPASHSNGIESDMSGFQGMWPSIVSVD